MAAVLVSVVAAVCVHAEQAGATVAPIAAAAGATRVVTLLTGDRVMVPPGGVDRIVFLPGKGRERIGFHRQRIGQRLRVVPSDALPALVAGWLDPRLFDITTLLEFGYDRRNDVPLIVGYRSGTAPRALGRVVVDLPAVNGVAVRAPADGSFWTGLRAAAGVGRVWLDGVRGLALEQSVPQIGAPTAWRAGLDGTGVTVAVLDTGVRADHPDLVGRVTAAANFTGGAEPDGDFVGHGTHVASTIAGTGAGRLRGVAPGARLLDGKVCSLRDSCPESWILAGMGWAVEQGADIVNMSLGGPDTPELDPVEQAVNTLTAARGVLFVVAAGNDGRDQSVKSPASADAALAVGAVTKADELARFSSRGPRVGDIAVKPDLTAPGEAIVAARVPGTPAGDRDPVGDDHARLSGTSMATPHVAGAAAILASQHPQWTPARLKAALMGSAAPHPALSAFAQGAGRVDVARAVGMRVLADPPSVSFGRHLFPHGDDEPVSRTVTYENTGDNPVTLSLSVLATNPDGSPAPADMFRVGATMLTVPARGRAAVTLTADTRVAAPDGLATGRLTATAGDLVVGTPFGVDKEPPRYDLTVVHTGRDGAPTDRYLTVAVTKDGRKGYAAPPDPDGTVTLRLPPGDYVLLSTLDGVLDSQHYQALLAQPRLSLSGDRTVHVDARLARPVTAAVVGQATARLVATVNAVYLPPGAFGASIGTVAVDGDLLSAQIGPADPVPYFHAQMSHHLARAADGPPAYHLSWLERGHLPTGDARTVRQRDLATVVASHAANGPGTVGIRAVLPVGPAGPLGATVGTSQTLPYVTTEMVNETAGTRWYTFFVEIEPDTFTFVADIDDTVVYRAGRTYRETWNRTVFGPTFTRSGPIRWRDELSIGTYHFFGDAQGRVNFTDVSRARTELSRDGVTIAEAPQLGLDVDLPPEPARYRLEVEAEREHTTFSTRISGAWTFRSAHVAEPAPVALFAVGFAPRVDDRNTVTGSLSMVPVIIGAPVGSGAGTLRSITVESSTDDGATWRVAPVLRGPNSAVVALVRHHGAGGFVSLRVNATDTAGNTAEQTIIRAYRFADPAAPGRAE